MFRETHASLMGLPLNTTYEFIEGDIKDDESLKTAFKDVETVFDLAGITSVPLSFRHARRKLPAYAFFILQNLNHQSAESI